jgi:hypothetical protein
MRLIFQVEEDYPEILTLVINPILKLMGRTNEDQLFSLFEKFLFKEKNYLNLSSFHLIMNLYANKGDPLLVNIILTFLTIFRWTTYLRSSNCEDSLQMISLMQFEY